MIAAPALRPPAAGLPARDVLLALIPPIGWGVALPLSKPVLAHFPPLIMMCGVYIVTAVIMRLIAGRPTTSAPRLMLLALMVGSGQGAMLVAGLVDLPASTAMLAVQVQTPFAVLAAWAIDGVRPPPRIIIGIVVALVGIGMIGGAPELPASPLPLLLVLGSALIWSTGQVILGRLSRDPGLPLAGGIYAHSAWQMILLSAVLERGQWAAIRSATPVHWLLIVAVALVGFVLAYGVWYQLLARLDVDRVVPFTLLTPVVTLVIAALTLGETLSLLTWVGAIVILAGLAVILRPERVATT